MRITSLACLAVAVFLAGCAGPEYKLGRGLNNVTEFGRLGEIRRSMEQTSIFKGPEIGFTAGFLHGFNRSVARTFVGAYEIVSSPFPPYDPIMYPVNPEYPESYRPKILADQIFSPDASLGFGGGDVAPFIPGSRFRIFDN
jgi:putative exosortase-associated protein (TIGR04073 family)